MKFRTIESNLTHNYKILPHERQISLCKTTVFYHYSTNASIVRRETISLRRFRLFRMREVFVMMLLKTHCCVLCFTICGCMLRLTVLSNPFILYNDQVLKKY